MAVVGDFVARDPLVLSPQMPIADAVAGLLKHGVSGAPVMDATGNLAGMLTAKDCFRAALHGSYYQGWSGVVADVMTREIEVLEADLDLFSAAQRFLESDFRRFPVMDDGRLLGVIVRMDLLRALNAQWG